jgi:hypothetical protein
VTGKRRGTDLCDGTVTLPVILAMDMEPGLRPFVADACQGPGLDVLCDRLAAHPDARGAGGRQGVAGPQELLEPGARDGLAHE